MSRTLTVGSARIARILEDGRRRRLLLSFVNRDRSLKEAAEINGLPLNLAHYHLRQLIDADLVEVTREQKRAGRPIKFYRARYSAYLIPAALLRSRPAEQLARSLATALENSRNRAGAGILLDIDDSGRARMREAAGAGPMPLEIWRRLNLSRREAERLFEELTATIHRYEQPTSRNPSQWIVHLAMGQLR
ncbi:MAG TPA: helix-turn-helix domain-containing protein [Sphingomicrobium sp.]|nr:helix-turn-helix domain-containing protein [Sphingomicrobium sp.]